MGMGLGTCGLGRKQMRDRCSARSDSFSPAWRHDSLMFTLTQAPRPEPQAHSYAALACTERAGSSICTIKPPPDALRATT